MDTIQLCWRTETLGLPVVAAARARLGSTYVSTTTGTPTCCATGVQMSASTVGVSIDTTSAYRAAFALRSRFG